MHSVMDCTQLANIVGYLGMLGAPDCTQSPNIGETLALLQGCILLWAACSRQTLVETLALLQSILLWTACSSQTLVEALAI
jgi:hypothetical protein